MLPPKIITASYSCGGREGGRSSARLASSSWAPAASTASAKTPTRASSWWISESTRMGAALLPRPEPERRPAAHGVRASACSLVRHADRDAQSAAAAQQLPGRSSRPERERVAAGGGGPDAGGRDGL